MRILETEINDISNKEMELKLVNDIIEYVEPIFNKEYKEKIKEIKTLKKDISIKQEKIKQEKIELENLFKIFTKKSKEKDFLNKIERVIETGTIQEPMKNEMIILLNSLESMNEEKIIKYLNETVKSIKQKFSKK